ncbi:MAG: hypothetical protein CW716_12750 [Candidatus Bathyarchaeum sp.]|nr:MAG: hypothetical protein CW716_12750 [Candidatus Bathyarchaeum sp.]
MSFRKNQRGQIRTIEALLASLLILSTIALVPTQFSIEKTHYDTYYSEGNQVLISLDSNGELSNMIENENWQSLKKSIQSMLPVSLWFNLTVFDSDMNTLNDVVVSNGGAISEEVVAINYVCASSTENYAVYLVRLQLAGAS